MRGGLVEVDTIGVFICLICETSMVISRVIVYHRLLRVYVVIVRYVENEGSAAVEVQVTSYEP